MYPHTLEPKAQDSQPTEEEGSKEGLDGIPGGKDDQGYGDPAAASHHVHLPDGYRDQGQIGSPQTAEGSTQDDVSVFIKRYVDAGGIGGSGVFSHGPHVKANPGTEHVDGYQDYDDVAQVDKDILLEKDRTEKGNVRKAGQLHLGEAGSQFSWNDSAHHVLSHKTGESSTENRQCQSGYNLIGPKGNGQNGKDQGTAGSGQRCSSQSQHRIPGSQTDHEADTGSHQHHSFYSQVDAAGFFRNQLTHGRKEQGSACHDGGC